MHAHTGVMRRATEQLKYCGDRRWSQCSPRSWSGISTRTLATSPAYDLIIANPIYPGGRRHGVHPTQIGLDHAAQFGPGWSWARGAVGKTAARRQLAGLGCGDRALVAGQARRGALEVTPGSVQGRRVLVYDAVFTTGRTLREVALKLRAAGAEEVSRLVLARRRFVERASST